MLKLVIIIDRICYVRTRLCSLIKVIQVLDLIPKCVTK